MKTKVIIIVLSVFVFCGGYWFLSFHNNKFGIRRDVARRVSTEASISPYKDANIKAVIIPAEGNTFGYDIYVYGSVLVHQPTRPGLPGNAGFATEEDAMKVAELVIKKIRNNEMPPTVTIEELRALGVL